MSGTNIDPTDPVFISYRHSDGTAPTSELAWLLRAAGIPVWRDVDDLPPGDTNERLAQAIADGLSGGVLVITQDVADSEVVRTIEAPRLLALHEAEPAFALAIVNAVERAPGKVDYTAPDRVLQLVPKTLEGTDQKPADRPGLLALVRGLLNHRIAHERAAVAHAGRRLALSIQTRNSPQVFDRTDAQLDIRVRPSEHERLPDPDGLRDLADTIGMLPDAVTRSGAEAVRVTGGAHLSVAFALGAALPSSRVGAVDVTDQRGETWTGGGEPVLAGSPALHVAAEGTGADPAAGRPMIAVYADLLPTPSDAAFERFLDERRDVLTYWAKLTPVSDGLLRPQDAAVITGELAARLKTASAQHSNAEVHLLLRMPFPIAVLTGRLTNTLRVALYEWDDSGPPDHHDYRPRYVPSINVRASAAGGVITQVLL